MRKIILDLCGGTGSWSEPYRRAGYDVRLITLPEFDVRSYVAPPNVHGILAAPPCEEFSLAKGSKPRDFRTGLEIVKACLSIIWTARLDAPLAFWCMENPCGFLRQFIGKPTARIQYWQYGARFCKPTDLWGYFLLPKQTVAKKPVGLKTINSCTNWTSLAKATRSKTPAEFAEAFFKANP